MCINATAQPASAPRSARLCIPYALSSLTDGAFGCSCSHEHTLGPRECDEIEGLVDELEAMPRSEQDELRRLREAQEDHAAATERLRASVAKTGAPHHAHLREKIDGPASHPRARAPPPHRVCWAATNLTLARTSP